MNKILILANSISGLYRFRGMFIERLKEKGYNIYCAVPISDSYKNELDELCTLYNIKMQRRGIHPFRDIKLLFDYFKIIKRLKPNMVLTYTIKPNIYGGFMCRLRNIPYSVNITGLGTTFQKNNLLKKFVIMLYKIALKKVKVVFFENEGNRNIFVEERIVPANKTCVLNGAGVDLNEFRFAPMIKKDTINFLFIGRIMREKGINELFSAAKRIKEEFSNTEFNFIGGFEEDYADTIKDMESKGYIKYYGSINNVQEYIANADCVILPSYHEGMSNALLEGAAMGRPLITSNIHGCKEAVVEGKNGFLCKIRDEESLYNAIKRFIELPFESKKEMGEFSRQYMEQNFDKRKVVEKTIDKLGTVQ